ncbi:MAG: SDR family oxidoreductase [Actinomycetota bacterium]|nr:SDR family oxidoreductase [Actinomycetota bacterium]
MVEAPSERAKTLPEHQATAPQGRRLERRRAIITGAARGIGAEIARSFAAHGAQVAIIDKIGGGSVAEHIGAPTVQADLADPDATRRATQAAIETLGGVDILVNNAGILRTAPILDITVDEWDLVFAVNARSMLITTQVAAAAMRDAGRGGTIVNMSSMGAKSGATGQAHYAASKAAVIALTQVTAQEFGADGITANAICPGYVLTDMGSATRTDEMVEGWRAKSPLGRIAEPSDVACMAVFLASAEASYCTGQAFNVNGGMITH